MILVFVMIVAIGLTGMVSAEEIDISYDVDESNTNMLDGQDESTALGENYMHQHEDENEEDCFECSNKEGSIETKGRVGYCYKCGNFMMIYCTGAQKFSHRSEHTVNGQTCIRVYNTSDTRYECTDIVNCKNVYYEYGHWCLVIHGICANESMCYIGGI